MFVSELYKCVFIGLARLATVTSFISGIYLLPVSRLVLFGETWQTLLDLSARFWKVFLFIIAIWQFQELRWMTLNEEVKVEQWQDLASSKFYFFMSVFITSPLLSDKEQWFYLTYKTNRFQIKPLNSTCVLTAF